MDQSTGLTALNNEDSDEARKAKADDERRSSSRRQSLRQSIDLQDTTQLFIEYDEGDNAVPRLYNVPRGGDREIIADMRDVKAFVDAVGEQDDEVATALYGHTLSLLDELHEEKYGHEATISM